MFRFYKFGEIWKKVAILQKLLFQCILTNVILFDYGGNMAADDSQLQLVSFKLGKELYGVNIMDVKEIVKIQKIRPIPNAPYYMVGILNLRGEIIPIIDLHRRFQIATDYSKVELNELESGFIILKISGMQIGIIIDSVSRVLSVQQGDIQDPPQMMNGIGTEYINGVVRNDDGYLIILDTKRLFDPKELQRFITAN